VGSRENRGIWGIFIVLIILFAMLAIFTFYTIKSVGPSASDSSHTFGKNPQIAVVEISGVIMEAKTSVEKLLRAEKDKNIRAIIVRVNSPGGAVGPTQEIYQEIKRIDKEKPVYASFGSIAASGGYYIGAAARKIYSNPGTLTGSIGVLMQFFDLSKLYEFAKVSPNTIISGRYKDMGQPTRPMTDEESSLIKELMEGVHRQFIKDILERRTDKIKGKMEELAQGQIFSGEEAYLVGLVDEMGSLWQAGRRIHNELLLKGEFGLKFIKKKKDASLWTMLERLEGRVGDLLPTSQTSFVPMFLFSGAR
jgi:protease IV